jgi:hypothetical protein
MYALELTTVLNLEVQFLSCGCRHPKRSSHGRIPRALVLHAYPPGPKAGGGLPKDRSRVMHIC